MKAYLLGKASEILCDLAEGIVFDKAIFVHVQSSIEFNLQAVAPAFWAGIFANQLGTFVGIVDAHLVSQRSENLSGLLRDFFRGR